MNEQELKEIRERAEKATPGRWYWHGYKRNKSMYLLSTSNGHQVVMDFDRWGMHGAIPRFRVDGIMHRAEKFIIPRQDHKPDGEFYELDHPDADFIAHARTDIPKLLDEVERLRKQLKRIADCTIFSADAAEEMANQARLVLGDHHEAR